MKKAAKILSYILFCMVVFLPAGVILSACFGYQLILISDSLFSGATALIAIITLLLFILSRSTAEDIVPEGLLFLAAPLSLVHTAISIFRCSTAWFVVCMCVCVFCCFYLIIACGRSILFRIIAMVLSGLLVVSVCFYGFIMLILGNWSSNTVVKTLDSPEGTYYAEVINNDQGALGGNTFVDVYENKVFSIGLFSVRKKPETVYSGEWGECEGMYIYWENNDVLVINSKQYPIDD